MICRHFEYFEIKEKGIPIVGKRLHVELSAKLLQSTLFVNCEQSFATFILNLRWAQFLSMFFIYITAKDEKIAHFK